LYRRAIEQDPLSAAAHGNLGFAFDAAGRLAEGEQALGERSCLLRNEATRAPRSRETCSARAGMTRRWPKRYGSRRNGHGSGRWRSSITPRPPAEADAALRELIAKHAEAAAYQVAGVYAARGEVDLAFECLERAYSASDPGLSSMMVEPLLVSLHDDPRWGAFLRKMGLAD
jgi:tetratricopeptide (TPR) repeat protein